MPGRKTREEADDLLRRALDHHQSGRFDEACRDYQAVLRLRPHDRDALYLNGTLAYQTGDHVAAVELVRRALASGANAAQCHNIQGLSLSALGKSDEAAQCFERAIASADIPDAWVNLANLRKQSGQLKDAEAAYRHALRQSPQHANALAGLAQALRDGNRLEEAAGYFEEASALLPGDADLWREKGDVLQKLGRLPESLAAYRRGLALNPRDLQGWFSAGCAEAARDEYVAAVECFRKVLVLDPQWAPALHNLGKNLFNLGLVDEAIHCMRRAMETGPPELPRSGIAVLIPGSAGSDNQAILDARRDFAAHDLPTRSRPPVLRRSGARPIRAGYVSSLFDRPHWMKPIWGLINRHDRSLFEIHLFSDTPESTITEGYQRHPDDRFHDITRLSNDQAAACIEEAGIDILVDLNAYSRVSRLGVYALRPAPVIAAWFNLFATSGMDSFDYVIGDSVVIPPEEERYYTEKVLRVPGTYLTFEVRYPVPPVADPPCLTKGHFTFGSLATQYKLGPEVIAAWSRMLRGAPRSELFLKNLALRSENCRRHLRGLFEQQGVEPGRLRLEGSSPHFEFLQRYDEIDLALDPFPYSGGTTSSEAIWQGVPVLSFWGDRWAARTSASIMHAANLSEFVVPGIEEYMSRGIELANDPKTPTMLAELRRDMRARLIASPACDMDSFTRNMEQIYREIA